MEAHVVIVAIDKSFLLNKNLIEKIITLFAGVRYKCITTFTSLTEHFTLLKTKSSELSYEEYALQLLFRKYSLNPGQEIFEKIKEGNFRKEEISNFPDYVFSDKTNLSNLQLLGINVVNSDLLFANTTEFVELKRMRIVDYFNKANSRSLCKIRIEDRYILRNITNESSVIHFLKILNIIGRPVDLEIICSDRDYDYKGNSDKDFINKVERQQRIDLIKKIGSIHNIHIKTNAGHDRYLCTNNALYIIGNSITSDKETHITYYPLLNYYREYFKLE